MTTQLYRERQLWRGNESVKIRYVNGSFVAGMTAMSTGVHRHILFFRILKYVIIFVKIVRTKASFWYAKLGDQIKITEIIEIRTQTISFFSYNPLIMYFLKIALHIEVLLDVSFNIFSPFLLQIIICSNPYAKNEALLIDF